MITKMKAGLATLTAVGFGAFAGIGEDASTKVTAASTEANIVYVAVISAFAAFFVVRLIKKAL